MPEHAARHATAGAICAACGRPLTQRGPNGECLRCLMSAGLFAEEEPACARPASRRRATPGPLRYAHFEIEVGHDGFPIELGSGGMAVTYRARDTVLNSTVALKLIDCTIAANPTAKSRFLREARAAAQLHHPNVARVTHYGEQDGECFYVMELVQGETLEERVRREGPMPLAVALEVMEQAARALAAAEAHGVVHRDIKPSNIMIESEAGGSMVVKIIDYGVAKATGLGAEQTQSAFVGTPAFASPEQFAGAGPTAIDTRSDIYSLGVTLWYLLTGRTPFVGRTLDEVHARQSNQLPLEQLRDADVPAPVLALLKSMLAVDPADRPQSARELLAAVHRCYVRFEPSARLRRKRLLFASASAALLVAAAVAGTWFYQQAQSGSLMDKSIAVLPFDNLSTSPEDRFLAVGIQDEILTKLASLADLKVISRTSTDSYKGKSADLKTVGQQLGVGRVLEGSVQRVADRVRVNVKLIDPRTNAHLWASTYDRKVDDVFAVQSQVASSVAQQLNTKLLHKITSGPPTQSTAAYNAYLRGVGIEQARASDSSYAEAAAAYTEALRLDPNFALAWARLCLVRSFLYSNGVDRNTNSATAVREAADRAVALAPELGEAWLALGTYRYRVLRDFAGALQAYQEAEKVLPNSALLQEYMVYLWCRRGHWAEAEAHFWKAAELDPRNFRIWSTTASQIFLPARRFKEAQLAVDRALALSPADENAIAKQGEILYAQGRMDEAGEVLARLPVDSRNNYVINLRTYLAVLRRDYAVAIATAEQAINNLKPGQPLGPPILLPLLYQGYCQLWSGRPEEARATFQRVVDEIAPTPSLVAAPGREMRSYLAWAYAGLGDREKALEHGRQAVAEFNDDAAIKPLAEVFLARIQAHFGDADAVVAALPHLLAVPHGLSPVDAKLSPSWDPIRSDPRFTETVEKFALPASR